MGHNIYKGGLVTLFGEKSQQDADTSGYLPNTSLTDIILAANNRALFSGAPMSVAVTDEREADGSPFRFQMLFRDALHGLPLQKFQIDLYRPGMGAYMHGCFNNDPGNRGLARQCLAFMADLFDANGRTGEGISLTSTKNAELTFDGHGVWMKMGAHVTEPRTVNFETDREIYMGFSADALRQIRDTLPEPGYGRPFTAPRHRNQRPLSGQAMPVGIVTKP